MKKLTLAADLGGAPFTKSDLRTIFNQEIWDAIEGMCSPFDDGFGGTQTQGVVISGCGLTHNGSNFDMAAGIVYLNKKFLRVPAAVNQPFPQYIQEDTAVNDTRSFADGGSHVVAITSLAKLANTAPGSGQYITLSDYPDSFYRSFFVSAQTEWTNLALLSNWVTRYDQPQFRVERNRDVVLRGSVFTNGANVTSLDIANNLPHPLVQPNFTQLYSGGTNYLSVTTGGILHMSNGSGSPADDVFLDGVRYSLR